MNVALTRRCLSVRPPTRFLLLATLFAASIHLACSAETPELIERPNADSEPTEISTEIWAVDIDSIDSAQQSFVADIAVVLRWKDSRLAHTSGGVVHYWLGQIWHPRVVIVNETNSVIRRLPESADVEADGTVLYRQRYVGSFTQPLHLQSFPFDKQISASIWSPSDTALTKLSSCPIKSGSMPVLSRPPESRRRSPCRRSQRSRDGPYYCRDHLALRGARGRPRLGLLVCSRNRSRSNRTRAGLGWSDRIPCRTFVQAPNRVSHRTLVQTKAIQADRSKCVDCWTCRSLLRCCGSIQCSIRFGMIRVSKSSLSHSEK